MITTRPDKRLTLQKLDSEVRAMVRHVRQQSTWHVREKYVDGGQQAPFYILRFQPEVSSMGDDLMSEPLFGTRLAGIRYKHITRDRVDGSSTYWKQVGAEHLAERLQQFMEMYRSNYLQPPGRIEQLYGLGGPHEKLRGKRFIFELGHPERQLVGYGPAQYASMTDMGAIRGRAMGPDGKPVAGLRVHLQGVGVAMERQTNAEGWFWFSAVPEGKMRLRIEAHAGAVTLFQEPFGLVRGTVQPGTEGTHIEMVAPDGEVFQTKTEESGIFATTPMPAFPYKVQIPGFSFQASIRVMGEGIVAGRLQTEAQQPLAGVAVELWEDTRRLAVRTSDSGGQFRFEAVQTGPIRVRVPGYRLYARPVAAARIEGKVKGTVEAVTIELIAKPDFRLVTESLPAGKFDFNGLVPGKYLLRLPENMTLTKSDKQN